MAVDAFGFAFLVALVYMAVRRALHPPARLAYGRAGTPAGLGYSRRRLVQGDWVFLGLLLAILVSAYVLTACASSARACHGSAPSAPSGAA